MEEYENVNFYSFQFEHETLSEFEKFLLTFRDTHPDDIGTIMYRLERIIDDEVFDRHFRYAGKVKDRTAELPSHFESTNSIKFSGKIISVVALNCSDDHHLYSDITSCSCSVQ